MKFLRILQEIGTGIGDPLLATSKDRAITAFERAVVSLLPDATQEEIPGYYTLKTDLSFSTNPADLKGLQMLRVKAIYLPPGTAINATVTYLEPGDLPNMAGIESLQPTVNDVFIHRVGNNLHAIVSLTPIVVLATQAFHLLYIKDYQTGTRIADEYDFSSAANHVFSSSFLIKCIDLAIQSLVGGREKQ